jgi:DNA-binding CsgD family transcriptional regulator
LLKRKVFAGSVETGEQVISNRELFNTEFYRDFLKPNIWLHACSGVTNVEGSTISCVYSLRSPRRGAFTSDEIGLCSYLVPHIQTAARIQQRVGDLQATLDRLVAGEIDTKALAKLPLTPAETQLAIALFKGQSVEAYAKEAGISINTARWYVKQIYAKTGVKRQTELVGMLLKCHRHL